MRRSSSGTCVLEQSAEPSELSTDARYVRVRVASGTFAMRCNGTVERLFVSILSTYLNIQTVRDIGVLNFWLFTHFTSGFPHRFPRRQPSR